MAFHHRSNRSKAQRITNETDSCPPPPFLDQILHRTHGQPWTAMDSQWRDTTDYRCRGQEPRSLFSKVRVQIRVLFAPSSNLHQQRKSVPPWHHQPIVVPVHRDVTDSPVNRHYKNETSNDWTWKAQDRQELLTNASHLTNPARWQRNSADRRTPNRQSRRAVTFSR